MALTKCLFTFWGVCGSHQIEFKYEIFLRLILVRIFSFLEIPCLKLCHRLVTAAGSLLCLQVINQTVSYLMFLMQVKDKNTAGEWEVICKKKKFWIVSVVAVCTRTKTCKYILIIAYQLLYAHNPIQSALIKPAVLQDYRPVFNCIHKEHDEEHNIKIKKIA